MRTDGTVPCSAGRTVWEEWDASPAKGYGVSVRASTVKRAAHLAKSQNANVLSAEPVQQPANRYSWITSGVPTSAKSQNQAASAVAIPIQPWLPGIPNVAGRRQ